MSNNHFVCSDKFLAENARKQVVENNGGMVTPILNTDSYYKNERKNNRKNYLNEEELKLTDDLDNLLEYYGNHTFDEDFEDELFKRTKAIMVDNNMKEYSIEWDTRNSGILKTKGLFCITFQFKDRKSITMNYYVGKEY